MLHGVSPHIPLPCLYKKKQAGVLNAKCNVGRLFIGLNWTPLLLWLMAAGKWLLRVPGWLHFRVKMKMRANSRGIVVSFLGLLFFIFCELAEPIRCLSFFRCGESSPAWLAFLCPVTFRRIAVRTLKLFCPSRLNTVAQMPFIVTSVWAAFCPPAHNSLHFYGCGFIHHQHHFFLCLGLKVFVTRC